jgi:hypothetical protein
MKKCYLFSTDKLIFLTIGSEGDKVDKIKEKPN